MIRACLGLLAAIAVGAAVMLSGGSNKKQGPRARTLKTKGSHGWWGHF